jgi:hypothetical protein
MVAIAMVVAEGAVLADATRRWFGGQATDNSDVAATYKDRQVAVG